MKTLRKKPKIQKNAVSLRTRRRTGTMGLTLLDVISCALGSAVLLAVLLSVVKTPVPPPVAEEFILMELSANGSGEIGYIVKAPQQDYYVVIHPGPGGTEHARDRFVGGDRPLAGSVNLYSSRYSVSAGASRRISYLVIKQPSEGTWSVLPYYYQFDSRPGGALLLDSLQEIEVRWWTKGAQYPKEQTSNYEEPTLAFQAPGVPRDARDFKVFDIDIRRR